MLRSRPNLKAVFSRLTVKLRDPSIYTHPEPMESARGQGSDRQPKVAREPVGSRSGPGREPKEGGSQKWTGRRREPVSSRPGTKGGGAKRAWEPVGSRSGTGR